MIVEGNRPLGFALNSRRARRVYVVLIACACLVFCWAFVHYQSRHGMQNFNLLMLLGVFSGITGLLGGVRALGPVKLFAGLRIPFRNPAPRNGEEQTPWLDEREQNERNRIHFHAYVVVRWLALLLLIAYAALGSLGVSWFNRIGPVAVLLLALVLWVLPQLLILWTEPDLESCCEGEKGGQA